MRFAASFLFCISFLASFPQSAEAAKEFVKGDRVLLSGRLHRKCVAQISEIPSPGFATLKFDRAGCGDASQPYEHRKLQHLTFVDEFKGLRKGDLVAVSGHFSSQCGGTVKEITKSGYVSVDFDSLLCADTEGLYKASDMAAFRLVSEASLEKQKFELGQKITTKGIYEREHCTGEIRKLTDSGLASVQFEQQTCANAGKLYPLSDLNPVRSVKAKSHASGEGIFQRVMREIASSKKSKKHARR